MILLANFKQNCNLRDIENYFNFFIPEYNKLNNKSVDIVFCPSNVYLHAVKNIISSTSNLYVGAQNVAKTERGAFTGEVSANQLNDYCSYCLVGHSERRKNFNESSQDINLKITNLLNCNIIPVACIRNIDDFKSLDMYNKCLVAYEPVEKIGGIEAESAENLLLFYNSLSSSSTKIIYGGSVNSQNISMLSKLPFLKGFLVGSASLQPESFIEIISKVI